jgi:hypothetical protein
MELLWKCAMRVHSQCMIGDGGIMGILLMASEAGYSVIILLCTSCQASSVDGQETAVISGFTSITRSFFLNIWLRRGERANSRRVSALCGINRHFPSARRKPIGARVLGIINIAFPHN